MQRLILRETDSQPTVAGRTLTLRIATYDRVYEFGRPLQRERVKPGAFRAPIARPGATVLRFRHQDTGSLDDVYGHCVALRDEGDALLGDFEVFEGAREDKLLRLVTGGALEGASMGALVAESRRSRDTRGPVTDITRIATLNEVSLTPSPAYDDAGLVAVRDEDAATRAARVAAERRWWGLQ